MLLKSAFAWMLLFGTLILSGPIQADEGFSSVLRGKQLPPAARDRAFEGEVYQLLEQQVGSAARYVQMTRFGNTIVITGEVDKPATARVIDGLVLDAAGIKRETPSGSAVVPGKDKDCGGKPAMGNAKRRLIVKGNRDCSSLRGDEPGQLRGRVYNHLAVGAPDPPGKTAAANLLLAEAVMELVDAGHAEVLDRAVMRMVAQDGVLYIIGNPGETASTRIEAILMALPGVRDVVFYTG